jgi:hypothetical protein
MSTHRKLRNDYAGSCNLIAKRRFAPILDNRDLTQSDPSGVPEIILQNMPKRYDLYREITNDFHFLQLVTLAIRSKSLDDTKLSQSAMFIERIDAGLHWSISLPPIEGIKRRRRDIQQSCYLATLIYVAFLSGQHQQGTPSYEFVHRVRNMLHPRIRPWAEALADLFQLLLDNPDGVSNEIFVMKLERLMDVIFIMECAPSRDVKDGLLNFFLFDPVCEGRLQTSWKRRMLRILS